MASEDSLKEEEPSWEGASLRCYSVLMEISSGHAQTQPCVGGCGWHLGTSTSAAVCCSACKAPNLCSPFTRTDTGKWDHPSPPTPLHTHPTLLASPKGKVLVDYETRSDT